MARRPTIRFGTAAARLRSNEAYPRVQLELPLCFAAAPYIPAQIFGRQDFVLLSKIARSIDVSSVSSPHHPVFPGFTRARVRARSVAGRWRRQRAERRGGKRLVRFSEKDPLNEATVLEGGRRCGLHIPYLQYKGCLVLDFAPAAARGGDWRGLHVQEGLLNLSLLSWKDATGRSS